MTANATAGQNNDPFFDNYRRLDVIRAKVVAKPKEKEIRLRRKRLD
jgi:hypothetical protein